MSNENLVKRLGELSGGEIREITDHARRVARTRDPVAQLVYQHIMAEAVQHLQILSTLTDWIERGKPPAASLEADTDALDKEIGIELDVEERISKLWDELRDPDARFLLEVIAEEERLHERMLKYLWDRARREEAAVTTSAQ